jgi:hypothetical protein
VHACINDPSVPGKNDGLARGSHHHHHHHHPLTIQLSSTYLHPPSTNPARAYDNRHSLLRPAVSLAAHHHNFAVNHDSLNKEVAHSCSHAGLGNLPSLPPTIALQPTDPLPLAALQQPPLARAYNPTTTSPLTSAMVSQKKPTGASRNSRGGGIAKRKSAARTDRDGDLVMDPTARTRPGGGVSKGAKSGAPSSRDKITKSKTNLHGADFQQKLLKHVGSSTVHTPRSAHSKGLEELRITGHTNSRLASTSDGGMTTLVAWLEKKATMKSKRAIKIKKVHSSSSTRFAHSMSVRFRLQPISERRPDTLTCCSKTTTFPIRLLY